MHKCIPHTSTIPFKFHHHVIKIINGKYYRRLSFHRMENDKQLKGNTLPAIIEHPRFSKGRKMKRIHQKAAAIAGETETSVIGRQSRIKRQPRDEDFSKDKDATVFYGSVVAFSRPESGLWLNVEHATGSVLAKHRQEKNDDGEWRVTTSEEEDIALFTVS